jgi:hypothetical protein
MEAWLAVVADYATDLAVGVAIGAVLRRLGYLPRLGTLGQVRWALRDREKRSTYEVIRRFAQVFPTFAPQLQPKPAFDEQVEVSPEHRAWLSRQAIGTLVDADVYPDGVYWFFDQPDNLGRRFRLEEHRIVEIKMVIRHTDGDRYNVISRWAPPLE